MTSLLKNQIIKHLSKFVKNLSPDKINLSTLKGEGELTNLELDEKVLTSLLELPSWLTLDRAWCNRVSIRIPWTKLKSVPICLSLDEVHVSMGTCSELRQPSANLKPPTYAAGWKYGFSDKVVDGVTLSVNSLIINFKSPAFEASLQFSRILLESASPTWQHGDLRFSRLKDTDLGLILLFKELQWQTLRLEARSTTGDLSLPPLRLITNQSKCRITIKKRLLDCAVIGCRLVLIMDELLWVLTDAQLSAAVLFLQSLSSLIEQDTLVNQRFKAARKLETLPEYHAQQQQQQQHRSGAPGTTHKSPSPLGRVFARYDVLETSYHFFSEKIDFHFCDDPGEGRSSHPELKDGGALQVTLSQLQLDFYPYHWAAAEAGSHRKHWVGYEEGPLSRWVEQGIDQFTKQLLHMDSPSHNKLTRSFANDGPSSPVPNPSPKITTSTSLLHGSILNHLRQLMSTCLILRLGDFLVYRVTTAKSRQTPKEFIVGDRGRFPLPDSTPIVHMEFTQFYYPGDMEFPLPQPKCFVQLNPLQVNFDGLTILWLHTFIRGLEKTLNSCAPSTGASESESKSSSGPVPQLEIRLEALMPRMIFELPGWERPRSLQLQVSRLVCSNYRSIDNGSRADLAACLEKIQGGSSECGGGLCFASAFPARDDDLSPISETLLKHATQVQPTNTSVGWKRDLLWTKETSQIWFIHLDPFWADFFAASGQLSKSKPLPFIGTVPITIWMQPDSERISGLLNISSLVSVQLDRAEYVFLLRVMEGLSETTAFLNHQEKKFSSGDSSQSMVIGAVIPQVDVSILFPPQAATALQGTDDADSPMGDTESIYPDTSSMTDLAQLGRSMQGLKLRNSHSEYAVSQPTEPTDICSVNSLSEGVTLVKSQSDSMIEMSASSDGPTGHEDLKLSGQVPATSQRFVTFADRKQPPQQMGFSSITKGLHNFMSSMDAALKHSTHIPDDASDCYSIRSEGSSDSSDNFIVLQAEHGDNHHDVLGVFKPKASSTIDVSADPLSDVAAEDLDEVAVEVCEDTPTTSDHSSAGGPPTMASFVSPRNREVAVVTMHINDLEFIQQSVGSTSSLRLQAGHLSCNECTAISHEEFQSKFASRSRGWREVEVDAGRQPGVTVLPLRVRMEQKMDFCPERVDLSGSLREAVASATEAWIEASLTHLSLSLQLSSVTGLTAFVEDELVAPVVPLFINLRDIECTLIEDRPPIRVGGPPPFPAPPMVVRVKHLLVQRNHCGVISVGVNESNPNHLVSRVVGESSNRDMREAALRSRIEELERENASLNQRLSNKTN
ncbi:UHRF1-binding protein 1-like isoform X3 [Daphnia pulex]|uniref:UHRF1-binding protein 1-like isoform X3 n=1 Tax=Daphnia pulex TaxID=6669 RepID=UPI001EDF05EA|nr:UHRF1-binding protein 1-like isoform X3 [Daphnia pulex]